MTIDQMLALATFAAVTSITPGPNNTMILTSGVNFGFKRSIPHLMGITLGFVFMVVAVGMGLQSVFVQFPQLETVLRYAGTAYLLWLAWKIAAAPVQSASVGDSTDAVLQTTAKPMGFWAACAFQWVNPKAWIMAVSGITTYAAAPVGTSFSFAQQAGQVLLVALIFGLVNLPLVGCWGAFGSAMRRFLQDPKKLKIFNISMAVLLVMSLYPIIHPIIQPWLNELV